MMPGSARGIFLIIALALSSASQAVAVEPQVPRIQAKVSFDSTEEWRQFSMIEDIDIMSAKPGIGATIVTDASQLAELRLLGYSVEVEVENMQDHYSRRIRGENFGDFHTYSETEDFLDDLHATYPSITTAKTSIGTTHEGRDIWAMKISDNPDANETEPEVLFDGLHHAREPITVEVIMHYMEWLCDNYGTDPEATFLVNEREIWFIPIVNPDGYVYNEDTYPSGGGMWRKNRRDNDSSSCYGVDNNRNYPHMWGYSGVTSNPCGETYLGPSAGSEPENQAYMAFAAAHEFVTNISFHSVAAIILLPWGYDYTVHTDDDALYREVAANMALSNGYDYGQAGELLYDCAGTTNDWLYDAHDVITLCVEVGGSGFWPYESEIPSLRAENLWPQIYITRIAGAYLAVDDYTISGGDGDSEPDPGETVSLSVEIENQGLLADVTNVTVTLITDDAYVQMHDAESVLGTIAAGSGANNASDPFSFTVDSSTPDGHGLIMTLLIEADGFYAEEEFVWMTGDPVTLFFDDMESGTGNWTENDGTWGLASSRYHSSSNSYTDSPSIPYPNSSNSWIELATPVSLAGAIEAELRFWQYVSTELDYDYCYVEGSTDGGNTWYQIGPRYHGFSNGWDQIVLSLSDFAGASDFRVRFRLSTDSYVTDEGWYVDDVEILGPAPGNAPPTAPVCGSPVGGGAVYSSSPDLTVDNASDGDPGDVLSYGFMVYSDEHCTSMVASTTGVEEGAGTTSWAVDVALSDGVYWWRAYADDGTERGPLAEAASFEVEATGVDDGAVTSVVMHTGRPNPFRAETTIEFELPAAGDVDLSVYNVDGRLVRKLVDGTASAGRNRVAWDGRDENGARVVSGLYFARLESGDSVRRGKLIVLK